MTALIATAAALPAAVSAGIVWVTARGWRREAARLRRDAALDQLLRRCLGEAR